LENIFTKWQICHHKNIANNHTNDMICSSPIILQKYYYYVIANILKLNDILLKNCVMFWKGFDNLFNLNLKFGIIVGKKVFSFVFGRPKKEKKVKNCMTQKKDHK